MTKTKTPKPLEVVVQAECRAYLESVGCRVWRRNTAMQVATYKGKSRVIRSGEKGAADLFGVMPGGRHFELEVKRDGEKPRINQVAYLRAVNVWAPAFWVDDVAVLKFVFPFVLDGGAVEYLDDPWTFSVKVDKKTHRITAPGGEFQIVPFTGEHQ